MTNELERKATPALPRFRPNTDILEREDDFHIFVDMPGVSKDGIISYRIPLKTFDLSCSGEIG